MRAYDGMFFVYLYLAYPILSCRYTFHTCIRHGLHQRRGDHHIGRRRNCHTHNSPQTQPVYGEEMKETITKYSML